MAGRGSDSDSESSSSFNPFVIQFDQPRPRPTPRPPTRVPTRVERRSVRKRQQPPRLNPGVEEPTQKGRKSTRGRISPSQKARSNTTSTTTTTTTTRNTRNGKQRVSNRAAASSSVAGQKRGRLVVDVAPMSAVPESSKGQGTSAGESAAKGPLDKLVDFVNADSHTRRNGYLRGNGYKNSDFVPPILPHGLREMLEVLPDPTQTALSTALQSESWSGHKSAMLVSFCGRCFTRINPNDSATCSEGRLSWANRIVCKPCVKEIDSNTDICERLERLELTYTSREIELMTQVAQSIIDAGRKSEYLYPAASITSYIIGRPVPAIARVYNQVLWPDDSDLSDATLRSELSEYLPPEEHHRFTKAIVSRGAANGDGFEMNIDRAKQWLGDIKSRLASVIEQIETRSVRPISRDGLRSLLQKKEIRTFEDDLFWHRRPYDAPQPTVTLDVSTMRRYPKRRRVQQETNPSQGSTSTDYGRPTVTQPQRKQVVVEALIPSMNGKDGSSSASYEYETVSESASSSEEGDGNDDPSSQHSSQMATVSIPLLSENDTVGARRWPDITNGVAPLPIPAVNTIDDEAPPKFTYINQCVTEIPELQPHRLLEFLGGCSCKTVCTDAKECAHAEGNENPHAMMYQADGSLSLQSLGSGVLIEECNIMCSCDPETCQNRVVSRVPKWRLQLFKTRRRGWGLRTLDKIPSGRFVHLYTGEIITDSSASNDAITPCKEYLFELDHGPHQNIEFVIDASSQGCATRFINHSHDPNLQPQKVLTNSGDQRAPDIAFFSLRTIWPGEELTFNYAYPADPNNPEIPCHCGAMNCNGAFR